MRARTPLVVAVALAAVVVGSSAVPAVANQATLTQISSDLYTGGKAQHATEAEADTYHFGSTVVSTFQVGRFRTGGAVNIGWATSTDAGATWQQGVLPGITVAEGGPYERASDPVVAYDARHGTWLINTLDLGDLNDLSVSRSADGLTWSLPVLVVAGGEGSFIDKNWIACDNTGTSPHYGTCYVQYDDAGAGGQMVMVRSTDGGLTWSVPAAVAGASGIGGQPVVQTSGRVVVPYRDGGDGSMRSFSSVDGGLTWSAPVLIALSTGHAPTGMRAPRLPVAEVDGAGRVYVAWQDCRFRVGCAANDIVLSTSDDGTAWTPVVRIPIAATDSTVDAFIPGLGVDRTSSGATARLALVYYFYPDAGCGKKACALQVGYASSTSGGASWSTPVTLAGPMSLPWIADAGGAMVGDYLSVSILGDTALSAFAVAREPLKGKVFDQAMYAPIGLTVTGGLEAATSAGARQIAGGHPIEVTAY